MINRKHFLENALRTLGLGIVLAYGFCFGSAKFKLFGIVPMDEDALTIGFLLILIGSLRTNKQDQSQTPEKIINDGIVVLCGVLGAVLAAGLGPFLSSNIPVVTGSVFGFSIGFIICKVRPTYAESKGKWRRVLHFVLTQMDMGRT